jgi:hypothetical protein
LITVVRLPSVAVTLAVYVDGAAKALPEIVYMTLPGVVDPLFETGVSATPVGRPVAFTWIWEPELSTSVAVTVIVGTIGSEY